VDASLGTRGQRSCSEASARGPRAPERHDVFIGRDAELARIGTALGGGAAAWTSIVAVQGMAGAGKTYLAREFYARHPERFDSYQHVVLVPEHPGTVTTWIAVLGEQTGIDAERIGETAVAEALRAHRALVHVDNVDSAAAAELAAALARSLAGVPMLVTGRYAELGTAAGSSWVRIELAPLDPVSALDLLRVELRGAGVAVPETELHELVRQVAGLPLALHLAAGYLRRGVTVDRFLARLHDNGLALGPRDPADHVLADRARGVLSTSFAISRELMLAEAGAAAKAWEAALLALGWAPRAGFGRSLGAAITYLDEASGAFEDFIDAAVALSLAHRLRTEERSTAAWAVHPLLGDFLRARSERGEIDARIGTWAALRAESAAPERAARSDELSTEAGAIVEWLGVATDDAVRELLPRAWDFATSRGPVEPWLAAAQRVRRGSATCAVLWALCQLASRAGELQTAFDAATEMVRLAQAAGEDRDRALALGKIADVLVTRGELDEALRIRRKEQLPVHEQLGDVRARAHTLGQIADILVARGELDEALRIRREEQLPVYERLGDARARAHTLGQIADILVARGDPDEALQIYREEVLPVHERLGDVRARAHTLGQIADVLLGRGELDEALRICREEVLPIHERLGDVRSRAISLGLIADALFARGELDEALRIRREEQLPVYERLGDVRSRAISLGKIADLLLARGELGEALRIHREEALPVYERLGDARSRAIAKRKIARLTRVLRSKARKAKARSGGAQGRSPLWEGKISDVLFAHGEHDEVLRIPREEQQPMYEWLDLRSPARAGIAGLWRSLREGERPADVRLTDAPADGPPLQVVLSPLEHALWSADELVARGESDEALRILREEELPFHERIGGERSRAILMGKVADVLFARGELDEALRLRREEELPVYERLGDARAKAIGLGKVADVLFARGELSEALRIRREEELPVYAQLEDVRSRAVAQGRIADVLLSHGEVSEALRIRREEELPVYERLGDARARAIALERIADVHTVRGELAEALRIRHDEELPLYEQLGDDWSRELALQKIIELEELYAWLRDSLTDPLQAIPTAMPRTKDAATDDRMPPASRMLVSRAPAYERFGDVRSRAIARGRLADVLFERGGLIEALRIRRDEELPLYEWLGDVRSQAILLGKIADALVAIGDFEGALGARRESLATAQQLGDPGLIAEARQEITRLRRKRIWFPIGRVLRWFRRSAPD
jgi:tetratricopeptide (TPR) repeat protein